MTTINHASAYAHDPRAAAEHLAALGGGRAARFEPLPGAWAVLFEGTWEGAMIELYPRDKTFALRDGAIGFHDLSPPARGAGTHFNLSVDKTRQELESLCAARGLTCSWRGWAAFLDVWVDEELLVELVPRA
jgi:hypothetical protein